MGGAAAAASVTALSGCVGNPPKGSAPVYPEPGDSWRPSVPGLDAVIDISHGVSVADFREVRRAGILAIIHKATEGGDFVDASYTNRRGQAESAGLLWGAYHFGTRQYSGARQAENFLNVARPGPSTLLALDVEANDRNPANSMRLSQAEEFVLTVQRATGRLPMVYIHPEYANGQKFGRRKVSLERPVTPDSILARCDLWLADYREQPDVPYAWANKGWKIWQYLADEKASDAAHGSTPRAVPGVSHADRNLFNGDEAALYRYWRRGRGAA